MSKEKTTFRPLIQLPVGYQLGVISLEDAYGDTFDMDYFDSHPESNPKYFRVVMDIIPKEDDLD
jgi:hypothetical protein